MYTKTRGVLQECGDFTQRVSDCEELVGLITEVSAIYETTVDEGVQCNTYFQSG